MWIRTTTSFRRWDELRLRCRNETTNEKKKYGPAEIAVFKVARSAIVGCMVTGRCGPRSARLSRSAKHSHLQVNSTRSSASRTMPRKSRGSRRLKSRVTTTSRWATCWNSLRSAKWQGHWRPDRRKAGCSERATCRPAGSPTHA